PSSSRSHSDDPALSPTSLRPFGTGFRIQRIRREPKYRLRRKALRASGGTSRSAYLRSPPLLSSIPMACSAFRLRKALLSSPRRTLDRSLRLRPPLPPPALTPWPIPLRPGTLPRYSPGSSYLPPE